MPADADMIKGKIVKMFGGHKQFDLKLREALTAAVEGYTSHVELVAAGRALGAGRITASAKNKDSLKTFVQVIGRAGRRLLPPDPINLKCTHLDLSGMGPFTHEHGYGLAQLLRIDGSLIEVNLDGFALPIKTFNGTDPVESLNLSDKGLGVASAVVIASLISVNSSLMELKCAACPCSPSSFLCQFPLIDTLAISHHFPSCLSLAVSRTTALETRVSLSLLSSSMGRRSPTSSAPPPARVFAFVSIPIDTATPHLAAWRKTSSAASMIAAVAPHCMAPTLQKASPSCAKGSRAAP